MNTPILIIGPTSSGKTALSLWLAQKLGNTDILVVDSKQVYKGQDIVTGKDLPQESSAHIYGVNLKNPDQMWSVSQFLEEAKQVFEKIHSRGRNLIIVGGTPQYVLSLFTPPQTSYVPPNTTLRHYLDGLSVEELQKEVSLEKFASMNQSDRQNPRRLIRAIEIESNPWKPIDQEQLLDAQSCVWIGLRIATKEDLERRIRERVVARLANGAIKEYENLRRVYPNWTSEAKAAIGYSEIEKYVSRELSKEELIDLWTLHEVQYAKRQMQWWKRETHIQWFDALHPDFHELVFQRVKS